MTGARTALDERRVSAVVGLVFLVLAVAATVLAIEWRSGRFADDYELVASFDGVGQFFRTGAEVNVRGVPVGEVTAISLRPDHRADVRMSIDSDHRIPDDVTATIRGKSLLGPKYLDLAFEPLTAGDELLAAGDRIERTTSSLELEPVLTELHDFLEAVDPRELSLVLSSLSRAGRDQGEVFGRVIDDGAAVLDVLAEKDPEFVSALQDLAALSEELSAHGEDIVDLTDQLSTVLPVLTGRGDELAGLLESTSDLSADLADLMDANAETLQVLVGSGGRVLGVFDAHNGDVSEAVYAIAQFYIGFDEIVSLPVGSAGIAYRDEVVLPPTICELFVSGSDFEQPHFGPYSGNGFCAATPGSERPPGSPPPTSALPPAVTVPPVTVPTIIDDVLGGDDALDEILGTLGLPRRGAR